MLFQMRIKNVNDIIKCLFKINYKSLNKQLS
jgi:hypothetical protein